MQDSFAVWVEMYDEMDALQERKGPREEDSEQCFQKHRATWKQTARKTDVTAEKACWRSQRNNAQGQHLEHISDRLLNLAKVNGWAKDKEGMASIWIEKK